MNWEQVVSSLTVNRARLHGATRLLIHGVLVLAGSYVLASSISAFLMTKLMTNALGAFNRMSKREAAATSLSMGGGDNYRDIEKAIRDRNLFNSAGEFPDESKPDSKGEKKTGTFDINAPCSKPTVNVQLVGTIYLASGGSVATMQEQGYSESDIYKEGDLIVGSDATSIVRIERNRVVLNNNGVKECLELATGGPKQAGGGFPEVSASQPPAGSEVPGAGGGESASGGSTEVTFDEKYVRDELGEGFGTIIQKARLVPNTTDNQMNGFKIFAIDQSSILGKIGFQNGDIITQVNETSLKQPEQGFAVYQALQEEREVRFHMLRRGTTPITITVRIK